MRQTVILLLIATGTAGGQPPDPKPPVPTPGGDKPLISDKELITALIKAMGDADTAVRQNVAMAVSELGEPAVPPLTDALTDALPGRRAGAAYALGQIGLGAEPALPTLVAALADESPDVRRQVSYAISRILAERRQSESLGTATGGVQ